jgi:formylglycine-generating enzyme required for sulfatase activity
MSFNTNFASSVLVFVFAGCSARSTFAPDDAGSDLLDIQSTASEWIEIKTGAFWMGSPQSELCRYSSSPDREQLHKVTLNHSFLLLSHPVTQAEFETGMGYSNSYFNPKQKGSLYCGTANECPVESVTWWESAAYCNYLSEINHLPQCYRANILPLKCTKSGNTCGKYYVAEGICVGYQCVYLETAPKYRGSGNSIYDCPGYRLPTEAEYEYAERAGTNTPYYDGDGHAKAVCTDHWSADEISWYQYNSKLRSHPIKTKPPNAWGLYDMAGNVANWTHDAFAASLGYLPVIDPVVEGPSDFMVARGASWASAVSGVRSAFRWDVRTYQYNPDVGFRCAITKK